MTADHNLRLIRMIRTLLTELELDWAAFETAIALRPPCVTKSAMRYALVLRWQPFPVVSRAQAKQAKSQCVDRLQAELNKIDRD
jgi:hypothetical protein